MEQGRFKRRWLTKVQIFRKPDELYLVRYVIARTKWLTAYIHCFHLSDYNTAHDHPAHWLTIPLTCGYWEHLLDGTVEERKPFRPKFRTAREFHWVELKPGCEGKTWTLFFFFRRTREWGFLTKDGWKHHDEYQKVLDKL